MPMELELINSMFSKSNTFESSCNRTLVMPFMRDYAYLEVRNMIPNKFYLELFP